MTMKIKRRFSGRDTLFDLVSIDYNILPLLSRFNIPLGFGSKSIEAVCREASIDLNLFLLVVNFTLTGQLDGSAADRISPLKIVDFLHNSHSYFLNYKIPHIRANLTAALDAGHSDINPMILAFFNDFVKRLDEHFGYEEETVFPYIRSLAEGRKATDYSIECFRRHHEEVTESLSELKNLILRYYTTSIPNQMYDVLVDICNAEEDLDSHSAIENSILIPLVDHIEKQTNGERL